MKTVELAPLIAIQAERFPFGPSDLKEFPWKPKYESLIKSMNREMFSIIFEEQTVGAMFMEYGNEPELIFFEISSIWRGKGIGQAALDHLFDMLRKRDYKTMLVQTGRPDIYTGMGYQFKIVDSGHIQIDLAEPRPKPVYSDDAKTCFIYSPRYLVHDYPKHPEHDGRVAYTMTKLNKEGLLKDANLLEPRPATEEEILTVHSPELLEWVKTCSENGKPVTRDTPTGPESYYAAKLSFGGAIMAGELLETYKQVFVLCRPPGHHASRERAGGFCFFNNMAGLAMSLWNKGGRPMIIDWDVHHGNGTQEALYSFPIMYVSFHQRYLFPHTGSEDETGEGEGLGYTKNYPLPIGIQDDAYLSLFNEIKDIADDYKPDSILISAGQDGHYRDKLSGMRLTSSAYYKMGGIVAEVAAKHCDNRIALLLEGGYDLDANAEALALAIKGIRESYS